MSLSPQEIVRHLRSRKTLGLDGIANEVLRLCSGEITGHLADIARACFEAGYHPKSFRRTVTVVLRNEEKPGYFVSGSYRPIALENTLGKVVEPGLFPCCPRWKGCVCPALVVADAGAPAAFQASSSSPCSPREPPKALYCVHAQHSQLSAPQTPSKSSGFPSTAAF
jgi:hypothetical protein